MSVAATTASPGQLGRLTARLAGMTPSGRARVPAAWATYDFANTIFSYAVVSTAIGVWLTDESRLGQAGGQLAQGLAVAVSVGLNAIVSPILGALSDRNGRRMPFLLVFTALTIVPCALIGPSPAVVGAILFAVANFSYQAALIYYDATLKVVSTPAARGRLSGIGVGVGYLGTIVVGLLIAYGIPAITGEELPVESIFLLSAVLFAIFAAPMFLVVREPGGARVRPSDFKPDFGQLRHTIAHAREVPGLLRFLAGRFFYSDAVNTIIVVMSVVAVRAMGMTLGQFVQISLLLTVVAILASFGWGRLVDRFGPKRTLMWVLASWAIGLILGAISLGMPGTALGNAIFILAGSIVGSGLGGVQVADRVFMIRLSPPDKLGEFFGLYGLVGKGSQVIGQLLYAAIVFLLVDSIGNAAYQLAVLTLIVTMLIGYWLIRPVRDDWHGSGEHEPEVVAPPERLAPDRAPLEPRA
jgi:UMF1 family MFS transporter